jgi:hypothetical protein
MFFEKLLLESRKIKVGGGRWRRMRCLLGMSSSNGNDAVVNLLEYVGLRAADPPRNRTSDF